MKRKEEDTKRRAVYSLVVMRAHHDFSCSVVLDGWSCGK